MNLAPLLDLLCTECVYVEFVGYLSMSFHYYRIVGAFCCFVTAVLLTQLLIYYQWRIQDSQMGAKGKAVGARIEAPRGWGVGRGVPSPLNERTGVPPPKEIFFDF